MATSRTPRDPLDAAPAGSAARGPAEQLVRDFNHTLVRMLQARLGSYEDARERLNTSARAIAEQIVAAVPGQSWQFSDDPNVQEVKRNGLPCKDLRLTGSVALRPTADTVAFGRTFTSEEFAVAADIVRREAAKYGVTDESSLFDEQSRRDYAVQGNGYEFQLMQINRARLNITGDCFLMQRVLDLPPGQLPPKPPLTTTSR